MKVYRFVFNPIEENTYILADDSGECAIIDCGCYDKDEFSELCETIDKNNLKPVVLLNTHCHLDHIFGDIFLWQKFGIGALCNKDDMYNRLHSVDHAKMFGLTMEAPPDPAGYLNDGMIITFGNTQLLAVHVPGHSQGGMAFYCEKEKAVFTGDTLFEGSIGRTDLYGGNYETIINSIKSGLFTLPPETVVYPGHGPATDIDTEIKSNPYFTHI